MKWYGIPAPRGLKISSEADILHFYEEGRITSYIVYRECPDSIPFGLYLYVVNEKGEAKPCVTPAK